MLPGEAPRIDGIRVVDVADGKTNDVRGDLPDHFPQKRVVAGGVEVQHPHLMAVFDGPGHIVQPQGVDRIGGLEPVGGYEKDVHRMRPPNGACGPEDPPLSRQTTPEAPRPPVRRNPEAGSDRPG